MTDAVDRDASLAWLDEALEIQRALGDWSAAGNNLVQYGGQLYFAGDFAGTAAKCAEAVEFFRRVGHLSGLSCALWNQADVMLGLGPEAVKDAAPLPRRRSR